jgi:hypothetical protein
MDLDTEMSSVSTTSSRPFSFEPSIQDRIDVVGRDGRTPPPVLSVSTTLDSSATTRSYPLATETTGRTSGSTDGQPSIWSMDPASEGGGLVDPTGTSSPPRPVGLGSGLDPRASFPVSAEEMENIRCILAFADGVQTADPQDVQTAEPQGSASESARSPVLDLKVVDPYWQPLPVGASSADGRRTPLQNVSSAFDDWDD